VARRGAIAARSARVLGDLILVALFLCVAVMFLSGNGFIGKSDIQPYPY
jgi:hypothetical protein